MSVIHSQTARECTVIEVDLCRFCIGIVPISLHGSHLYQTVEGHFIHSQGSIFRSSVIGGFTSHCTFVHHDRSIVLFIGGVEIALYIQFCEGQLVALSHFLEVSINSNRNVEVHNTQRVAFVRSILLIQVAIDGDGTVANHIDGVHRVHCCGAEFCCIDFHIAHYADGGSITDCRVVQIVVDVLQSLNPVNLAGHHVFSVRNQLVDGDVGRHVVTGLELGFRIILLHEGTLVRVDANLELVIFARNQRHVPRVGSIGVGTQSIFPLHSGQNDLVHLLRAGSHILGIQESIGSHLHVSTNFQRGREDGRTVLAFQDDALHLHILQRGVLSNVHRQTAEYGIEREELRVLPAIHVGGGRHHEAVVAGIFVILLFRTVIFIGNLSHRQTTNHFAILYGRLVVRESHDIVSLV